MKKNILAMLFLALLSLAACTAYDPLVCKGEMQYNGFLFEPGSMSRPEILIARSDYIIHGRVLNTRTEIRIEILEHLGDYLERRYVNTIHRIEVTQVLKGEVAVGDVIETVQWGGIHGCLTDFTQPEPQNFSENGYYMFFLSSSDYDMFRFVHPFHRGEHIPEGGVSELEFSFGPYGNDGVWITLSYHDLLELIGASE